MNGAHIHLLLNHIPILGTLFGLIIFIFAVIRNNKTLLQTTLFTFIISAIVAFPVLQSGEEAEEIVEHSKEMKVSHDVIHEHEEVAETAFWLLIALGAGSLLFLIFSWKSNTVAKIPSLVLLVLAAVVMYFMAKAGNTGGLIKHPEINKTNIEAHEHEEEDHH